MQLAFSRPAERDAKPTPAQRASERRRDFEALFLRSYAGMRARSQPA